MMVSDLHLLGSLLQQNISTILESSLGEFLSTVVSVAQPVELMPALSPNFGRCSAMVSDLFTSHMPTGTHPRYSQFCEHTAHPPTF